jgi:hypothetical protein
MSFFGGQFFGGGFFGAGAQPTPSRPSGGRTWGYVPPRRKKRKPRVTVAVEQFNDQPTAKVAYVHYTPDIPSYAGLIESVQALSDILEHNAIRSEVVRRKIEEIEDENDIVLILSQL